MNNQTHEIETLDRFLDDLARDPDVPFIAGDLDPEIAATARRVVRAEPSAAAEETAMQARVWRQVLANAPRAQAKSGWSEVWQSLLRPPSPRAWLRVGMTLATLLVAVAAGLYLTASQTTTVSAQEIVSKAQATLQSPGSSGVQSFVLTESERTAPGNLRLNAYAQLKPGESLSTEIKRWYQAPNRWRSEYVQNVVMPDGTQVTRERTVHVSDGKDLWGYSQKDNVAYVDPLDPRMDVRGEGSLFGRSAETLQELFQQVSTCYSPKVTGDANIAGRKTYVVDLGATRCPGASGPEMQGRVVIWVDQDTYLVLKTEQHSKTDDSVIVTYEVTSVQYNVPVDAERFTFTAPAGTPLMDNRPKPAQSREQLDQQLGLLAGQVGFALYAPDYVPAGLAPRPPQTNPMVDNTVEITFLPTGEPDPDSLASRMKGLTIREIGATSQFATGWTQDAESATIAGSKGWVRRGVRNPDDTGTESVAIVTREGVMISVSSFTIAPDELIKIAASLVKVTK